jgi:hypothetical protein
MRQFSIPLAILCLTLTSYGIYAQVDPHQNEIFWETSDDQSIVWNLANEDRIPHADNIEMSGRRVAGIIRYSIDENRILSLQRHIIFPQLRVFTPMGGSPWLKYRAYLKNDYGDDLLPIITIGEGTYEPGPVDSVRINGILRFYHAPRSGLAVTRTLLPSMTERLFAETWRITNVSDSTIKLNSGNVTFEQTQPGIYGQYRRTVHSDAPLEFLLQPGKSCSFSVYFSAYLDQEPDLNPDPDKILHDRQTFLDNMKNQLVLTTPDPVLNMLFYFSKIRAAESIYATPMGLVHSPGGGRYYTGVWANDQAEYSGPFFPYLGYETGNTAALNAYRVFLQNIPEGDGHFWSSFEMNGELTCCGADRGDAAMIAFGASHFAMAAGNKDIAVELWPLIEWSLDYCERQKNEEGVIQSDSDEMEGRIPTGNANLSTSSLYYGALLLAADLGREINVSSKQLRAYEKKAEELDVAIENYFGATIEGLETYRYFKGHDYLRHWICLPLVMGINKRKAGTLDALFSKLWTNNGVRVEYNPALTEPDLFWDRGTLYAFRGAFKAGATDQALEKLKTYSTTRLLGFHVPYVVEAWPEGNMAHLSAESALYCRVITEGLLGINPIGLRSFQVSPHLPSAWEGYTLNHVRAFGSDINFTVTRENEQIRLEINSKGKEIFNKVISSGATVKVVL